jgi:proteasome accessory factor C
MPKVELDGEEVFNLTLSVVGLVLKEGVMSIEELSQHFDVSAASILKAVRAITNSEDLGNYETHFYVDEDALEEGDVSFSRGQARLSEPPVLSSRQMSAIAAGLDYLASLPQFAQSRDLEELRSALGGDITTTAPKSFAKTDDLTVLRDALLAKTQLEIDYLNQVGERSSRVVDPLRIDFVGSRYYLRGYCHKNQGLRAFRVDRMASIQKLDSPISKEGLTVEIPEDVFEGGKDQHLVQIQCTKSASEIFWNFPLSKEPQEIEGVLRGEIRVGNLRALGRHVARYGGDVLVIGPAEARQAVVDYAVNALTFQRGEV